MKTITLSLDDADYDAIQRAMAVRQSWRLMPHFEGNVAGAVIAEICRDWMESEQEQHE